MAKTCLIVDDSRVVRRVARRILEDLGFACAEAENGEEALKTCAEILPQVVLLDWNMPVMDGMAFLKALRQKGGDSFSRIVMCTVENSPDSIGRALDAGVAEYIMKPFDADILESRLRLAGLLE